MSLKQASVVTKATYQVPLTVLMTMMIIIIAITIEVNTNAVKEVFKFHCQFASVLSRLDSTAP